MSQNGQQQAEDVTLHRVDERKHCPIHFSLPVLFPPKRSSTPWKRIGFRKHFPKVLQSKTLVAAGPGREGQESTYKNVLKIRVKKLFYVSILQLAPCIIYTLTPQKWGHLGGTCRQAAAASLRAWRVAGSKSSQNRPSPHFFFFFPFRLEKALFYLHIQELVGLVCFFGTINKRSNFFLLFSFTSIYQSGYFFWQFSSTEADLAKWT